MTDSHELCKELDEMKEESMPRRTLSVETVAQAYLRLLYERGIEYFFGNAGTDFAPIIDAFAWGWAQGHAVPTPITVPHENPAVAMAYGYYMVTGRPQAVMVHVNVGTANALSGIINAARDQVPILFTAGRTPITESGMVGSRDFHIHWAQESFDQAAMVREYVKWDYELRNFRQLEQVVDRALEIAMTHPRGPVYLTLPREVLSERQPSFELSATARGAGGGRPHPDPRIVGEVAGMLAVSEHPLIITTASGRNPDAVASLVELAECFSIPVIEFNRRGMCFPTDHPLHLGFNSAEFIARADAILVVDSDVPWFPSAVAPQPEARVVHIGLDPSFSRYPMRCFPCDHALPGDTDVVLALLRDALRGYEERARPRIAARLDTCERIHREQSRLGRGARSGPCRLTLGPKMGFSLHKSD